MIALCAAFLASASDADAAIIRLKPQATINANVILLGDVADVFDRDARLVQALRSVALQPAPAAGDERSIDFNSIRARLQRQGFSVASFEFTGSSSVIVKAIGRGRGLPKKFPRSQQSTGLPARSWQLKRARGLLSTAIENYLRTAKLGEIDVEVKIDSRLAALVVSGQSSGYEIRGGRPPWDAWQPAAVRFIDGDEQLRSAEVEFRVVVRPLVPVARRALPRGEVIRREDIGWKRTDANAKTYPAIDEIVGRETTHPLRPGQIIDRDAVRQVPLVRRGDVVTALARVGGITVKRQLLARSDGALGDRIILASADRRDQLEATVVGYHEALVLDRRPAPRTQAASLARGQSIGRPSSPRANRHVPRGARSRRTAVPGGMRW